MKILLLLIFCFNLYAVDKEQLYKELRRYHINVGYSQAKKYLFGMIYLNEVSGEYFVTDLYCNKTYGEEIGVGPLKNVAGTKLNCEHSWPKAHFNKDESYKLQEADLHHLFPVDSKSNAVRGNVPFAVVNQNELNFACSVSKYGKSNEGVRAFEPSDSHKGNVARAMFYFSIRYRISIDEDQERYFRTWHKLDPVDAKERFRNGQIESIQGNRNPFIDNPQLVDEIADF